jgi:outer membrane protein assembly factor BamB
MSLGRKLGWTLVLALLCSHCFAAKPEGEWPQWRGPLGTGAASDATPPIHWNETENVRWKTPIPGRGHSTPCIWGDHVFLTYAAAIGPKLEPKMSGRPGEHDNLAVESKFQFVVVAVSRSSGEILWQKVVHEEIPIEGGHQSASLASASPLTDGEYVYAYFGSQGLHCLDFVGNLVWTKNFGRMHSKHGHGEGSSPALSGDTLVVNWDHEEDSFIVALNKRSGEQIWKRERDEVTSWSTPIVVEHHDGAQVIVCGTSRVRGYDLKSGDSLWECGGLSANIVGSPVFANGIVVVGSSYEKKAMLAIRLEGARGDITGTQSVLWSRTNNTPYVPSMLLSGNALYFLSHYQNILTRIDVATGQDSPGTMRLGPLTNIYASPVSAGGNVFVTDLEGSTLILSDTEIPRIVAVNSIGESVNASLAIAGNEIYIRGDKHLFCIASSELQP